MRLSALPVAVAFTLVLTGGLVAQQVETNDAGGSLVGTNCFYSPSSTLGLTVSGAPNAPIILVLGQLATNSVPTDASQAEWFDLNLAGFLYVVTDGFGGSGLPFFNHTNPLGSVSFAFGANAGVNVPFAFQAVVADPGAPFGLNFTKAQPFMPIPVDLSTGTLLVGDDSATNFSLTNPICMYGTSYSQIRVSTNGWISFAGAGNTSTDLSESTTEFINGQPGGIGTAAPLVAVLWDDLDVANIAGQQGVTIEEIAPGHVRVAWINAHKYPDEPLGTFYCDIDSSAGVTTITMVYDPCLGQESVSVRGLIGVSAGSGAANVNAVDLATGGMVNSFGPVGSAATIYEDFNPGGTNPDVGGATLTFLDVGGCTGDFFLF